MLVGSGDARGEGRDATASGVREATTEAGRRASRASRRPAAAAAKATATSRGRGWRVENDLSWPRRARVGATQENAEGSRRAAGPTNASPSKRANDAPTSPRDVEPAWRPRMARDTGAGRSGGAQ